MAFVSRKDTKTDAPLGLKGPVLIVDDDPSDAMFAEDVLSEFQPKFPVQILTSGADLFDYLEGKSLYQDRNLYPYPSLILLDLKMPNIDGFAVLEWLKVHPQHANVPVIVLSGYEGISSQVTRAYQLGARSFLPKPVKKEDIEQISTLLNVSI
jgi:CheY-like chemotaxis protein